MKRKSNRFTDPIDIAMIWDEKGNIIYPTDPKEIHRELERQKAWDHLESTGDWGKVKEWQEKYGR